MHGSVSDLDAKTMCWIACLATVDTFMRMDCPLWNKVDPNTNCLSIRFQGDRQLHASKEHPIFSMSSATFQLSAVEISTLQKLPLQFSVSISATMALMRYEIKAAMGFCFHMFILFSGTLVFQESTETATELLQETPEDVQLALYRRPPCSPEFRYL